MRFFLPLLALLLLFSAPVGAAGWTRHDNRALIEGSRAGWALETPDEWVAIPDVKPSWPMGAGFRDPAGQSGVVVSWVPRVPGGEIEGLTQRGYQESPCRLGGHEARLFSRVDAERVQRVVYLAMPQGAYRVLLFSRPGGEETLDKILRSFQLVRGLSPTGPERWSRHQDKAGFQLSYPGEWTLQAGQDGFELADGGPAVRASLRRAEGDPGQSFRGFARALGKTTIPGASSLERFEPLDAGGTTGYLAVWKLQSGDYFGPVVYLPLQGPWRALELLLLQPKEEETFFRILDTFQPGPPIQARP